MVRPRDQLSRSRASARPGDAESFTRSVACRLHMEIGLRADDDRHDTPFAERDLARGSGRLDPVRRREDPPRCTHRRDEQRCGEQGSDSTGAAAPHLAPRTLLGCGVSGSIGTSRTAPTRAGRRSVRSSSATALAAGMQNGSTPAGVIFGWPHPPQVPSKHGTLRDPWRVCSENALRAGGAVTGGSLLVLHLGGHRRLPADRALALMVLAALGSARAAVLLRWGVQGEHAWPTRERHRDERRREQAWRPPIATRGASARVYGRGGPNLQPCVLSALGVLARKVDSSSEPGAGLVIDDPTGVAFPRREPRCGG